MFLKDDNLYKGIFIMYVVCYIYDEFNKMVRRVQL